jgi:hypothetical protein
MSAKQIVGNKGDVKSPMASGGGSPVKITFYQVCGGDVQAHVCALPISAGGMPSGAELKKCAQTVHAGLTRNHAAFDSMLCIFTFIMGTDVRHAVFSSDSTMLTKYSDIVMFRDAASQVVASLLMRWAGSPMRAVATEWNPANGKVTAVSRFVKLQASDAKLFMNALGRRE